MTFLIDGYNMMHAVGLASKSLPPGGLERARTRFLDWLADTAKGRGVTLRVVFDAQSAAFASPEAEHRGVRVRYATRRTADDEIEDLLAAERRPSTVTVVSNDRRVREAGRRAGCDVQACEELVDFLIEEIAVPIPPAKPEAEKPVPEATAAEMAAWLDAFTAPPAKRRKP